jgi:hypothetical protein
MSRLQSVMLPVLLLVLTNVSPAGDRDFDAVVRAIESHFQTQRTHIPMMGLVKFVVRVGRPSGVKQLDLAIFEDLHSADTDGLDELVRRAAGGRWRPMVSARSSRDNDATFVYWQDDSKDWTLLVATFEPDEATLVKLKVDAKTLAHMLAEPTEIHRTLQTREDH